jgi:hypothetical protein
MLLVAGVLLWLQWQEFWAADACLDSGGSYDYLANVCDQVSHPYLPQHEGGLAGGLIVLAMLAPGWIQRRKNGRQ